MYIRFRQHRTLRLFLILLIFSGLFLIINRYIDQNGESSESIHEGRVILTIGDSNGIINGGWPTQLKQQLNRDKVLNRSTGGLTIGFDNCFKTEWNALKQIEKYLKWAYRRTRGRSIDAVVILLGTNDCKACFDDRKDTIASNMVQLIYQIRQFDHGQSPLPHIMIVTPPPYAMDSEIPAKARGGNRRVLALIPELLNVALKYHCGFVNIYDRIEAEFSSLVSDHVHLTGKGHQIVAQKIAQVLNDRESPQPPSGVVKKGRIIEWDASISDDVIGYEINREGRIIDVTPENKIELPEVTGDIRVCARDGYGNRSVGTQIGSDSFSEK